MFLTGQDTWPPQCTDLDEDGYGNPASELCTYPEPDCDDSNADVYPSAPELCDGTDTGACTPPHQTDSPSRTTYYGDSAYNDFPAIWIDWYRATDYCARESKRLPTEAEWEYAARGGLDGMRTLGGIRSEHASRT